MIRALVSVSTNERDTRAWVEVDLAAVVENARFLTARSGARLLPVVKANAYGVGAVAVSRALEVLDPWGYGVATVAEGVELRAAGITRPILVFLPARPERFATLHASQLIPTLGDAAALREWRSAGGPFHLEIDTGMSRTGVRWDEVAALADVLDTPDFDGCFMQFHSADAQDGSADAQLTRFHDALGRLRRRPRLIHVANSAAALRGAAFAADAIRPGLFLYGGEPADWLPAPTPVVSLRAQVCAVRQLRAGEGVSYGGTWTAAADTTIATVAIGYGDGLTRGFARRGGQMLVRGKACPVVGVVTMDFTMIDAGSGPVAVGDTATLIGSDGDAAITLSEVARRSDRVQWEVLTSLGARLPRIYR